MSEYIDREKLADGLKEWQNRLIEIYGENDEYVRCLNSVLFSVDNAPAADVRPVVRGSWLPKNEIGDCCYQCSDCGFVRDAYILDIGNYCPNCGARMEES